ncbi:MAG TPA: carboxypeptidase-like regulatory domain-containing protein [Thermoanaerobaculia bacterium]
MRNVRLHSFLAAALVLGISLTAAPRAFAQATDAEPNSTCTAPQDLGAPALPFTVQGSLDTPPATPDVDFYRFTATPGSLVRLDLDGLAAGAGTLRDPYLGQFENYYGECYLINYSDDSVGTSAGLDLTVPDSGEVLIAVTSFGDWEYQGTGGSAGTYRLTIREQAMAEALEGRVLNARTGAPVAAAAVSLLRCDRSGGNCYYSAGWTSTGADGTFRFQNGTYSVWGPFLEGSYKLSVQAVGLQVANVGPYTLADGQVLSLGDIPMQPTPAVGSITGRLVDEITGQPLNGKAAPYAQVALHYCHAFGCSYRQGQFVQADGTFRFEGSIYYPLAPGRYRIVADANQYQQTFGQIFEVADGDHLSLGDFRVKSMPARVELVEPCAIPAEGGTCRMTMRVTNGSPTRLEGEAWGVVQASWLGSPAQQTRFQVGSPRALSLAPGDSVVVPLTFEIPGAVSSGSFICVNGFAAQRPHEFNTLGTHELLCFTKGVDGFLQVPEDKKHDAVRRARGEAGPTQ